MGCKIEQRGTQRIQQTQDRQPDSPSSSSSTNFLVTLGTTSPSWLYSSSDSSASLSTKSDMAAASHTRLHRTGEEETSITSAERAKHKHIPLLGFGENTAKERRFQIICQGRELPSVHPAWTSLSPEIRQAKEQPSAARSCQPMSR